MKRILIAEMIPVIFIILFLYTGISKLMDFEVFREQLSLSPVLSSVSTLIAWGLPVTEFIIATLLFIPKSRLAGLYATSLLMLLFTIYVALVLSISKDLPCSCGGIISELSWPEHLILNIILTGLSISGIVFIKRSNESPLTNRTAA